MHVKYNAVLRGCTSDSMDRAWTKFDQLCKGNKYATTLHVVNSAVVKLSKLTKAAKVYRGIAGVTPACGSSAGPAELLPESCHSRVRAARMRRWPGKNCHSRAFHGLVAVRLQGQIPRFARE